MKQLEINGHVRAMTDADGAVLLDLKAGKYYSLNAMGARIWQKVEDGAGRPEILEDLQGCFAVSRERLEADLESFVEGLRKKELIRVRA